MKFEYQYRSGDNVKHHGTVCAATRDAAFAVLKAQGIRPERVCEAPGFFNKLFGKGKRWVAIVILGVISVALAVALGRARTQDAPKASLVDSVFDSPARRQIVGDTMVVELGIRTGWTSVFENEGDRFLASFAIPGVPAGLRNTTEEELLRVLDIAAKPVANEGIEARQIRAMVGGMKKELREFLNAGGSVAAYGRKLVARQEAELSIRNRMINELDVAKKSGMAQTQLERMWEKTNGELRMMGIKLVDFPE